jgi:hypothetical protein
MVEQTKDKVGNLVDLVAVLVLLQMRHQVRDQEILEVIVLQKELLVDLVFPVLEVVVEELEELELMVQEQPVDQEVLAFKLLLLDHQHLLELVH